MYMHKKRLKSWDFFKPLSYIYYLLTGVVPTNVGELKPLVMRGIRGFNDPSVFFERCRSGHLIERSPRVCKLIVRSDGFLQVHMPETLARISI